MYMQFMVHSHRDVNEVKLPVSSLGIGSIKLSSCMTWLLNEPFVDKKYTRLLNDTDLYKT
jgi:hypothetical protein